MNILNRLTMVKVTCFSKLLNNFHMLQRRGCKKCDPDRASRKNTTEGGVWRVLKKNNCKIMGTKLDILTYMIMNGYLDFTFVDFFNDDYLYQ